MEDEFLDSYMEDQLSGGYEPYDDDRENFELDQLAADHEGDDEPLDMGDDS